MKGLLTYFQEIWSRRFFWLSLVRVDLRARYRGSAFGIGWSLLHPIAMTVILCVAFSTVFKVEMRDFAPYLMAGLTLWGFITNASQQGCQCFFTGEGYIRQHPAPMAIYPLRTVLGAGFHFLMAYLMVITLTWICHGWDFVGLLPLLSLLPTFALLFAFGWSLAVLFGLATVRFRDVRHLTEVAFQALFYMSPTIYPADKVQELLARRTVGWIFYLNPFVPFFDLVRAPVVHGQVPSSGAYLAACVITLIAAAGAGLALKSEERKIIFHL